MRWLLVVEIGVMRGISGRPWRQGRGDQQQTLQEP